MLLAFVLARCSAMGPKFAYARSDPTTRCACEWRSKRLTPQTVYRRFFQHLTALTSGALREATELDFHDHVGLALTVGEGTSERLIAVGQFVRVAPGADCAEMAFVVADDYQHRGAATLLLRHLLHVARGLGVRELLALVLEDNREMLEVLREFQTAIPTNGRARRSPRPIEPRGDDVTLMK